MRLSLADTLIFFGYFFGVVIFAVTVAARSKTKSSADYFLASRKLPWYAVGASFVASNISTEHFIGMIGWGFLYGMAVANWEWANVFTFTVLIYIFLPFYMRGNVSTMPEFLELRFNRICRHIYAVVMIVGLVIAMLGGVLFAGAKAVNVFFPDISLTTGILLLALAAGIYTIYGGLLSAAWADLLQYILLMLGGIVVLAFGLYHAGGIRELFAELPEKFIVFYPADHEMIPWTGWLFGLFSVGIWYNCANQFMVQRCLGARSEWDARMGVVMAGFSKAILPLIVVLPGIIAFYLFQDRISDGDQAWPFLVRQFLPTGLIGLVLAGLASAILSTLSAITNSSATIFTLDLYRSIFRPHAADRELHLVGRLSGAVVLSIGVLIAIAIARNPGITVFQLIQTVFFYIAPPIAAIFLIGIMWPRATPVAATVTLIVGFCLFLPLTVYVIFPRMAFLRPFDNFMHHTAVVFALSGILLVVVSLFTKPKPREELKGVIWSRSALGVSKAERGRHSGLARLSLWWSLMVIAILSLYVFTNSRGSGILWLEAEMPQHVAYRVSAGAQAQVEKRGDLQASMDVLGTAIGELKGKGAGASQQRLVQLSIELESLQRKYRMRQPFNLWTGAPGQVLFTPRESGDSITFELPVKEAGKYRIAALVTMGPDYGRFSAQVNHRPAEIHYGVTERTGNKFTVIQRQADFFDGRALGGAPAGAGESGIAGAYTVHRIHFGDVELEKGPAELSLTALDVDRGENSHIGVDQLMIRRVGE